LLGEYNFAGQYQQARACGRRQWLLLMDTNENGKISKQEWTKFMEAEFDRLDKGQNWTSRN
jgi:hypothetical protein